MLQNAYFLPKIGADTAENEQHFAEILRIPHANPRGAQPGHVRASGQLPGHLVARAGAEPADELRYVSSWLVL